MGLKCSPDTAQAAMENVLSDNADANVYINDVLVLSPMLGTTMSIC
jgi:hypothetical protein